MMSTFLLIHGAWHGGWCWDKVAPLIEAAGHTVIAPEALVGHLLSVKETKRGHSTFST